MINKLLIACLIIVLASSAKAIVPVNDGGTGVTNFVGALTNTACGVNSTTQTACGKWFGFSNVLWFGATCPVGGGHDDTAGINAAMVAAAAGGWNAVALPAPPAKCLILGNIEDTANGMQITVAGPEFGTTYDGTSPTGTLLYLNDGFMHGTYNGAIDLNGFADLYTTGFTILADGASYGGVGIFDSFNTTSPSGNQPRWHGRNMSFTQIGNAVGCDVKTSGVSSGPPQCSTSGLGSNLVTGDCYKCDVNEGGVVSLGNVSDLRWDGGDIAAEYGGFFAIINSLNIQICPDRLENGSSSTGISGMFSANLPMVGVDGAGWTVCSDTTIRDNQGAAFGFYNGASSFKTAAYEEGNGINSGVEMADFNITTGSPTAFAFNGVVSGSVNLTPATHLTQTDSTDTVNVTYNYTGGAAGALAHSGTRDNALGGTITGNYVNVLGENNTVGTGLSASGNVTSSNAEQTISYQPGLLSAVNATKGVFSKFPKASTVDNIEGSAITFSCISNPTITLTNCHADTSCATSPTVIGTVTVTSAGTVVDGTVSSAAIAANEYVAWSITAGTCASIDIAATAQAHSN